MFGDVSVCVCVWKGLGKERREGGREGGVGGEQNVYLTCVEREI